MIDYRKSALVPYDKREAMTVSAAARVAGRSAGTILAWCKKYDIARKIVGGNWAVSRVALQMLLDQDLDALAAYGSGDRASLRVAAYFKRFGLGDLCREPEPQK